MQRHLISIMLVICVPGLLFSADKPAPGRNLDSPADSVSLFFEAGRPGWDSGGYDTSLLEPTDRSFLFFDTVGYVRWSDRSGYVGKAGRDDSTEYELTPTYVGGALWSTMKDVEVSGSYAYGTFGPGLAIFDIGDPASPELVSQFYTQVSPEGLDLAGNYAYVTGGWGDGGAALMIIDISDPLKPVKVGQYGEDFGAWNVRIVGELAYLCAGDHGLHIVDISDPTNPEQLGYYDISRSYDVAVNGIYAYATDCNHMNMTILNISDPANPWLYKKAYFESSTKGIAVRDNYVYVAQKEMGGEPPGRLLVVDVSDPYSAAVIGTYENFGKGNPCDLKLVDNHVFVALRNKPYVHIIDISDPIVPTLVGIIDCDGGDAMGVDVVGDYAYIADGVAGFRIADISDLSNPEIVGEFSHHPDGNFTNYSAFPRDVEISGDYAYVATRGCGLEVVDISDPASPVALGSDEYSATFRVEIQGDYAFVGQDYDGVRITDITDPANPTICCGYNECYGRDIDVAGDYLYMAADILGLQILDISDLPNVTRVGYYDDIYYGGHEAWSIEVAGDFAYLGDYNGMQIIDITDRTDPQPRGKYFTYGRVRKVTIRDNYAFLADAGWGMQVVDVSNPDNPTLVGIFDELCDIPYDIVLSGDYAYIANGWCAGCDLKIVNISDLENMTLAGVYDTPADDVEGLAVRGRYAYVADAYGFLILSLNLPYMCGDVDGDDTLSLLDIVYLIDYLYREGEPPVSAGSSDTNADGAVNILDIIRLIDYLYRDGPEPVCP